MIYKPIKTLTNSGIHDITIVLGGESVGDFIRLLGDGNEFNANFNYVYQQKPGGIAEALYLTKKIVEGHKLAVILGDNIFENTFKSEIDEFGNMNNFDCCLFLKNVDDPKRFGVAELNSDGTIKSIEEKPKVPRSNYAVTGLYIYEEKVFEIIKKIINKIGYSNRGELEITDVNRVYLARKQLNAELLGRGVAWLDTGTHQSMLEAAQFIEVLEHRQSLKIGCPEEVAWRNNFISVEQLRDLAKPLLKSGYGQYLMDISNENY